MAHDGRVAVDGVRLSDLSIPGWLGLGLSAVSLGYLARESVGWLVFGGEIDWLVMGAVGVLFGAAIAYMNGRAECDATCDHCGDRVWAHSGRDGDAEVVEVRSVGSPRRARLGPLSLVVERERMDHVYCSGECAEADSHRRVLIDATADDAPASRGVVDAD